MPTGVYTTSEKRLEILRAIAKGQGTHASIGKDLGVSTSVVAVLSRAYLNRGSKTLNELAVPQRRGGQPGERGPRGKYKKHSRTNQKQIDAVLQLREEGLTLREIGEKLQIHKSTIIRILYPSKKGDAVVAKSQNANGNGHNHINHNIPLGIAYAETERFIAHLSARLNYPPEKLRPRLSELLGHSVLREKPGDGD